jgi:hypothetical protein
LGSLRRIQKKLLESLGEASKFLWSFELLKTLDEAFKFLDSLKLLSCVIEISSELVKALTEVSTADLKLKSSYKTLNETKKFEAMIRASKNL